MFWFLENTFVGRLNCKINVWFFFFLYGVLSLFTLNKRLIENCLPFSTEARTIEGREDNSTWDNIQTTFEYRSVFTSCICLRLLCVSLCCFLFFLFSREIYIKSYTTKRNKTWHPIEPNKHWGYTVTKQCETLVLTKVHTHTHTHDSPFKISGRGGGDKMK